MLIIFAKGLWAISYNVLVISEVPNITRNFDKASAKSDMHLLNETDMEQVRNTA